MPAPAPPPPPRNAHRLLGQVVAGTVQQALPHSEGCNNTAHVLVPPQPGSGGKTWLAHQHACAISHEHVKEPAAVFSRGGMVRVLVTAVGKSGGPCHYA